MSNQTMRRNGTNIHGSIGVSTFCPGRIMTCFVVYSIVAAVVLLGDFVEAELLQTPTLQWSLELGGSRTLGRGNTVQVWRDHVFVTAADASLHILDKAVGSTTAVFEGPSSSATCQSGVAIVQEEDTPSEAPPAAENNNGPNNAQATEAPSATPSVSTISKMKPYLVYAVTIESTDTTPTSSRVVAVNIDNATERWSVIVPGTIVGTPVVGKSGRLIYVSHREVTTESEAGFLSVISVNVTHTSAQLTATLAPPDNRIAPLGPPALRQLSTQGGSGATVSSSGDFVAVAESLGDGLVSEGALYVLVPSAEWETLGGLGDASYEWKVVSQDVWRFSAVAAPTFVDDSIFIGGTAAIIAGWTDQADISAILGGQDADLAPEWILQLRQNNENEESPFVTSPVLSLDGSRLFTVGPDSNLYCIRTETGRVPWAISLDNPVISQPALFESKDGTTSVLYVMENPNGRIRQFIVDDGADGQETWAFNCEDASGIVGCTNEVQADFSVAENGNILFYGDTMGRITALQVATFVTSAPTAAPTVSPTVAPTVAPIVTSSPTALAATPAPSTDAVQIVVPTGSVFGDSDTVVGASEAAADNDKDNVGMGLLIGVIIGSLVIILFVAFFLTRILLRPRRRKITIHKPRVVDNDIEVGLESKGSPSDEEDDDSSSYDSEDHGDDVTVVSGSSGAVELELAAATGAAAAAGAAASNQFRTPKKKGRSRKMKRVVTPPTVSTLESIEEAPDEDPIEFPKTNLETKFRSLIDDVDSVDDETVASVPPPPPPILEDDEDDEEEEEEKKTDDSITLSPKTSHAQTDEESFTPIGEAPNSPSSIASSGGGSFMASVNRALDYVTAEYPKSQGKATYEVPSLMMSPSTLSTESSIYTTDNPTKTTARSCSPLSATFGDVPDDGSVPGDEAHNSLGMGALDYKAESAVPGAHYLAKGAVRPRFKPSGHEHVPTIKSARTLRNFSGFAGNYLDETTASTSSSSVHSAEEGANDPKAPPTFKRRIKPDKSSSVTDTISDTWNSFLDDLAAAEEQFFSPTAAQKSVVLRYTKDEDSLLNNTFEGTDEEDDDDQTLKTGIVS